MFALVDLALVCFALMKGIGVPKNYALLLVLIRLIEKTSPFHNSVVMYIYI